MKSQDTSYLALKAQTEMKVGLLSSTPHSVQQKTQPLIVVWMKSAECTLFI